MAGARRDGAMKDIAYEARFIKAEACEMDGIFILHEERAYVWSPGAGGNF